MDDKSFFVFQVDTAGWLLRAGKEKGPASLSVMQSRKNLMRAHVIALVLDAEEVRHLFYGIYSYCQSLLSEATFFMQSVNLL